MHTGVISFCDRIAFNIKSSEAKDVLLEELWTRFQVRILQKHWFRLDEKNKDHVARAPHMMMLRSNGNPYYLYMTTYEDVPQMMFIDKKVQPGYEKPRILLVRGQMDDVLFKGTLMEGEMVKDEQGQWLFLINDVLGYQGVYLENEAYPARLGRAYHLLRHHYRADPLMDVCQFHVKKIFPAVQSQWADLIQLCQSLPYTHRGIYLWPFYLKYKPKLMNFDDTLIKKVYRKVKDDPTFRERSAVQEPAPTEPTAPEVPPERPIPERPPTESSPTEPPTEESRRLFLRKTENPDVYHVYAEEQAKTKMGVAHIPTLAASKYLRSIFKDLNVVSSVSFSCTYHTGFEKWVPGVKI